jgi:hypothetical protein
LGSSRSTSIVIGGTVIFLRFRETFGRLASSHLPSPGRTGQFLIVIPHASPRSFWETRAKALAWRINAAAWLARLAPASFFVASAFAVAVYALRRVESPLAVAWIALSIALALSAAGCWWRARCGFFAPSDARVLLESHLRLDTRLTAAELGLVGWPPAPRALPAVVQWQLRTPAGWLVAAAALIAIAVIAPVPRDASAARASGPPPALVQTEAMLDAIKEMKIADPQAIEQLQERARELARRPTEEQYSHSALEAADALRNQTVVSAAGLARGLDSAANALRAANNSADMNGPAGQLSAALSGLRDGALPANKDLLGSLPASAMDLKNLTPEQREQLAQQLANAANGLSGVGGAFGAGARVPQPDPNETGEGYGSGGPGGGGGTAPLMLNAQQSDAGDGSAEALSGDALKRFSLGDKLGTTKSAHDVDPTKAEGPTAAGAVATPASGGEAVWVNRLTPSERAALKKFFK